MTLPIFPKSQLDRIVADGIPAATVPRRREPPFGGTVFFVPPYRTKPVGRVGEPADINGRPRREWGKQHMRHRIGLGTLLASATLLAATVPVCAQGGGLSDYYVPSTPSINAPLPTGNPRSSGVFVATEAVFLIQSRTLRNQVIATRGFYDAGGLITGTPGTFVGSGATALQTDDLGSSSLSPGSS